MKKVATATIAAVPVPDAQVRLTLPPDSRIRPGSPFFNNMPAVFVGPDRHDDAYFIVKVDGSQVRWLKQHVHTQKES